MARIPSLGQKGAAARGAGPASKLQRMKVSKVAVSVPPALPSGCALVSADLLQHLQEEVGIKITPRGEPKQPPPADPLNIPPAMAPRQVPKPRKTDQSGPGKRAPSVVKPTVSSDEAVPMPPGARYASVGTMTAVEEGTQTSEEESHAGARESAQPVAASPPSQPVSARDEGGLGGLRSVSNAARHPVHGISKVPTASESIQAPRQVAETQPEEPSLNYGRCDPFHMDRITAEKDRDRKRAQAQMLAEQIQEQRERKEEERQRLRDEERMEEQRVARELRELEERQRREQAAMAAKSAAAEPAEAVAKVPGQRGSVQGQVRRRRSKDAVGQDFSPSRGGGTYDGTAGTWVDGEPRRRRPRRRRREVDSTTGGGQDGSWRASERDKRTWRDENYSSLSLLPDGRDTSSPVPWLTASPQDNADGPDGLSTVLETGEMKGTEARRLRGRRRRERRADSYDENDTWESANNRKSQDDMHPQRVPVAADANWARDEDDDHRRRRGRAQPPLAPRRGEQASTLEEQAAAAAEKERSQRVPAAPMMSEAELQQIRSLVRVCEQLLRERAEEKEREAARAHPTHTKGSARGSPKQAQSPAARKSDRLSPSRHGTSKQAMGEEAPRGASGAALASQATKNSHASGNGWVAKPAGQEGSTAAGKGASDMHSWGGSHQPEAPGDPKEWSSDALMELMHGHSRMVGMDARLPGDIPEGQVVSPGLPAAASAAPAPSSEVANPYGQPGRAPLTSMAESPFASPARGVALRRSSRRDSRGGLGDPHSVFRSWGGRMLASPPPISRGGLNVQASWEPLGYDQGSRPHPFHKQPRHSGHRGPGQVPIGINPSIQAQSAMLREMYPNVPMGGPGPGPLSLAPTG